MNLPTKRVDGSLGCLDCGTPLPGVLMNTAPMPVGERIGNAWACPSCAAKYPSTDALVDRLMCEAERKRTA